MDALWLGNQPDFVKVANRLCAVAEQAGGLTDAEIRTYALTSLIRYRIGAIPSVPHNTTLPLEAKSRGSYTSELPDLLCRCSYRQ
jgi:hypothetical protein